MAGRFSFREECAILALDAGQMRRGRSDSMDLEGILKRHFGYSEFRPGQRQLIEGILAGRDVLGVMPTGGGKSLCYQIPALLEEGMTLVISPLISLMKDQVTALRKAGIAAAYLNSTLSPEAMQQVYEQAAEGAYRLLYVAPERLGAGDFLALTRSLPIALVAVDEAHCISQWGQDFRPSYLQIARFVGRLPHRPVIAAFTATATTQVRSDIVRLLQLRDPLCEITGFDRPNLFFDVQSPHSKQKALLRLVEERRGKSGIIYCATRVLVEQVCQMLCANGIPATRYHAGLADDERQRNQDDFQFDRRPVMVATNAFGMGIDKSNVSYVIHYNMPKSLEAYYQEAGRAGRDGEPADCILLYSAGDITTAKYLIAQSGNDRMEEAERERVRRQEYDRLQVMIGYCKTTGCLRGCLLDYFGQAHAAHCGSCGNCLGRYERQDITVPAQMILSCAQRIRHKLGYYVGRSTLVQVLRGSRQQRILAGGLDQLSTYGLLRRLSAERVYTLIDYLESAGYLMTDPQHFTLRPTQAASAVLFEGEPVWLTVRSDRAAEEALRGRRRTPAAAPQEQDLFAALKATRFRLAQQENVPAYLIFSNATLTDMANRMPRNRFELLDVAGVGEVKAERYGEAFLETIADYLAEQGEAEEDTRAITGFPPDE